MTIPTSFSVLALTDSLADVDIAGGKGANLSILARAGFPVPAGFILPTPAYQVFAEANHLKRIIQKILNGLSGPDLDDLNEASQTIRAAFIAGKMPETIRDEICNSFKALGGTAVAVRSSATTEDLPELSFAGQQDTFLNITSEEVLIKKVIECWASLWTARAIDYRVRQNVPQDDIALAVVVQQMVESQVSGVLFTANPLTGLRTEVVIDATVGLGEALVSGLVDPDHYVVDMVKKEIKSKKLGAKATSIRATPNGGVRQVSEKKRGVQALGDEQIKILADMGKKVEQLFGAPQDIEWALNEGKLYLLQSRPITSLFPLPAGMPTEPLKILLSFANVQGMMDPITPIGQSGLKFIFATGSGLFGIQRNEETQTVLYSAGERLWINITPLIKNSFGRKVVPVALELVEPTIKQALLQIQDDPRLQPGKNGISLHARMQLARFFLPLAGNVFLNILAPARRREYIVNNGEQFLKRFDSLSKTITGDRYEKLVRQSALLEQVSKKYLGRTLIQFISGVASGMVSWNVLNMLTKKMNGSDSAKTRWSDLVMEITRGMPYNPTTEMDLTLWHMMQSIRRDPASVQSIRENSPAELSRLFQDGELPAALEGEINRFLDQYGGRGFGEIDLGRIRWAENPTHVFEMLASFLQIEDADNAPDAVFARGVLSANQAIGQLTDIVRKTHGGMVKAVLMRFFANRARQLMGMRESPKFFAVRMMWIIHREIIKTGQEFVEAGEFDKADDLLYLTFPELLSLANHDERDWRGLITDRRGAYQRELRRRQIPRLLSSDGRAFYEGMNAPTNQGSASIVGSPVSPGLVEGIVRVVFDPGNAHLVPGEIMVCPGTDPSWTPLFMAASGLVMEVGGMMTHGAVVAREYGIPAVVGVTKATSRLINGQRIRLNGSSGEITLLD